MNLLAVVKDGEGGRKMFFFPSKLQQDAVWGFAESVNAADILPAERERFFLSPG